MNRLLILIFVLAVIAIGAGAAWYLVESRNEALRMRADAITPPLGEGMAIYTNGTYGFSVFYPESATVSYAFDPAYHLGTGWRALALADGSGVPLVAFVPYAVASDDSYPRYFNAMVRIGVSSDPKEVARCMEAASEQGETALGAVVIGGATWNAFSFESAGMMQYASGVSYRTLHEDRCIAMERVRTGSSYREDAPSPRDIPDETLDAEYGKLSAIVESFLFVR